MQTANNISQKDFNQLLTENRSKVFNSIKNKVGHRDIAEDLLQDTLLEAHKSFHNFRQESKFSTWLIGIAMNIVRNYYSRSPECRYEFVEECTLESDAHIANRSAKTINMEQSLIDQNILGQVMDHLENLPTETREIISLSVNENLTYKDIAKIFDTSVSNIKIKVFRAREKLKNLFDIPVFGEAY